MPLQAGTVAGFIATVPMTIFMLLMHSLLPRWQKSALPPEEITEEMAERAQIDLKQDKVKLLSLSLVAHFSYGASMGSLYALLTRKISLPAVLKGTLFGLVIWTASYLGWLPLGRFSSAAPEETLQRNLLMIVAHVIWGSVTGIMTDVVAACD